MIGLKCRQVLNDEHPKKHANLEHLHPLGINREDLHSINAWLVEKLIPPAAAEEKNAGEEPDAKGTLPPLKQEIEL